MADKDEPQENVVVYVRLPTRLARRLDRRVEKRRKDAPEVTRSSEIRRAVAAWLDESDGGA